MSQIVLENVLPQIRALNSEDLRKLQRIIAEQLRAAEPERPTLRERKRPPQPSHLPPGFVPRIIGESPRTLRDRSREWAWLREFGPDYAGQWVALDGDRLVAHGPTLQEVAEAAEAAGVKDALTVSPEPRDAPAYCSDVI